MLEETSSVSQKFRLGIFFLCFVLLFSFTFGSAHRAHAVAVVDDAAIAMIVIGLGAIGLTFTATNGGEAFKSAMTGAVNTFLDFKDKVIDDVVSAYSKAQFLASGAVALGRSAWEILEDFGASLYDFFDDPATAPISYSSSFASSATIGGDYTIHIGDFDLPYLSDSSDSALNAYWNSLDLVSSPPVIFHLSTSHVSSSDWQLLTSDSIPESFRWRFWVHKYAFGSGKIEFRFSPPVDFLGITNSAYLVFLGSPPVIASSIPDLAVSPFFFYTLDSGVFGTASAHYKFCGTVFGYDGLINSVQCNGNMISAFTSFVNELLTGAGVIISDALSVDAVIDTYNPEPYDWTAGDVGVIVDAPDVYFPTDTPVTSATIDAYMDAVASGAAAEASQPALTPTTDPDLIFDPLSAAILPPWHYVVDLYTAAAGFFAMLGAFIAALPPVLTSCLFAPVVVMVAIGAWKVVVG